MSREFHRRKKGRIFTHELGLRDNLLMSLRYAQLRHPLTSVDPNAARSSVKPRRSRRDMNRTYITSGFYDGEAQSVECLSGIAFVAFVTRGVAIV